MQRVTIFSIKGQIVTILSFVAHMVFVKTNQLCCYNMKGSIDINRWTRLCSRLSLGSSLVYPCPRESVWTFRGLATQVQSKLKFWPVGFFFPGVCLQDEFMPQSDMISSL